MRNRCATRFSSISAPPLRDRAAHTPSLPNLPHYRTHLALSFHQAERHRDALEQDLATLAYYLAAAHTLKLQEDIENTVYDFLCLYQDANATPYLQL